MDLSAVPLAKLSEAVECLLGNPYDSEVRERLRGLRGDGRDGDGAIPAGASDVGTWIDWARAVPEPLRDAFDLPLAAAWGSSDGARVGESEGVIRRVAKALDLPPGKADLACRARSAKAALDSMVGDSAAMRALRGRAFSAAFGDNLATALSLNKLLRSAPVLIRGETGTGKELLAEALKWSMPGEWGPKEWKPAPYEAINLASIPETLVTDALFGHEKGAFSGAAKAAPGVLERCHDGVVFLDEVAELPAVAQVALLRALQEGEVRRLGADKTSRAAPRVVGATHRNLGAMMASGTFRPDLFHRLAAIQIATVPLRERPGDAETIAETVIAEVDSTQRGALKEKVREFLRGRARDYHWPGNVRELQRAVRGLALGIPPELDHQDAPGATPLSSAPPELLVGRWTMEQAKRWYARHVQSLSESTRSAASRLGVHRGTLARYVQEADDADDR